LDRAGGYGDHLKVEARRAGPGALKECDGVYIIEAMELLELLESPGSRGPEGLPRECTLVVEPPSREKLGDILKWRR